MARKKAPKAPAAPGPAAQPASAEGKAVEVAPAIAPMMVVETWPIERPKPYAGNPRSNESAIGKVADAIRRYGFRQPLVVDEADVIIVGHTRLYAARQLGLTHVPVHIARGLSAAAARAYRLADNRTAEDATWDPDALKAELEGLQAADVDLLATGFEQSELDTILGIPGGIAPAADLDDEPEPLPEPTVKVGDLYQCGVHRVLCGDARVAADWQRLMGDERADLVVTDPPYDVRYEGKTKRRLKLKNDALGHEGTVRMLRASLSLALGYCRDGAGLYVFAPHGPQFLAFAKVGTELGWWRQTILWVKDGFVMGRSDMHYRHEAILEGIKVATLVDEKPAGASISIGYGWRPNAAHKWHGERNEDTVWEHPRPRRNEDHPTKKPVELMARALRNSSAVGALVVDPFVGSGSTLVAAEANGRRAAVMDIDPRFVEVTVRRWEGLSGQRAALIARR